MVRSGAVHLAAGASPPEVAAAHHNGHLSAQGDAVPHAFADLQDHILIEPKLVLSGQGLAAEF